MKNNVMKFNDFINESKSTKQEIEKEVKQILDDMFDYTKNVEFIYSKGEPVAVRFVVSDSDFNLKYTTPLSTDYTPGVKIKRKINVELLGDPIKSKDGEKNVMEFEISVSDIDTEKVLKDLEEFKNKNKKKDDDDDFVDEYEKKLEIVKKEVEDVDVKIENAKKRLKKLKDEDFFVKDETIDVDEYVLEESKKSCPCNDLDETVLTDKQKKLPYKLKKAIIERRKKDKK